MTQISYFKKIFNKTPDSSISFDDYLNSVKLGKWEDQVLKYRSGQLEKKYLPAVSPHGIFTTRKTDSLQEHSGIINIDIDDKENPGVDLIQLRDQIYADPFVFAGHISVSGHGLSLYIKINPKKHYESFCAIEKYMINKYDIVIDTAAKDIPRLRFVSLDPELHVNNKAKKWSETISKEKQKPRTYVDFIASNSDFEHVIQQIDQGRINITEDYHDWIQAGFAIASEHGENGRSYFHIVSRQSSKYSPQDTDEKYTKLLKSKKTGVTISTFFWMAKNAGCEVKSHRTKKIEKVAKLRIKQVGLSGGPESKSEAGRQAEKYLAEQENITGQDVAEIIEKITDLNTFELSSEKSDIHKKIDVCMQIFKQKEIVRNIVTGKLEINGKQLTDTCLNTIYIEVIEIDSTINRELFNTLIQSERIKQINPFMMFIDKHKHLTPSGNINKLINCIDDEMYYAEGEKFTDYKAIYVYKWLVSIMASIHGTYSLMILVLTGKQMIEKTNWFRNLLPASLSKYYAESKLDAGKDDEILMTQKLLIVDDEFGGKSKQEAKKLKDLSSKQYFSIRRPYSRDSEDIRRIAVLGGTSNDDEILNDPTGNRRIIPLKVISIDKQKYDEIDKTELFMEIYHAWKEMGDAWMLTPQEVKWLNIATSKHEQEILEYQLIQKHFILDEHYFYEITSSDVKILIEQETTTRNLVLQKIGQSLKKLGYKRKAVRTSVDGKPKQCWNIQKVTPTTTHETAPF